MRAMSPSTRPATANTPRCRLRAGFLRGNAAPHRPASRRHRRARCGCCRQAAASARPRRPARSAHWCRRCRRAGRGGCSCPAASRRRRRPRLRGRDPWIRAIDSGGRMDMVVLMVPGSARRWIGQSASVRGDHLARTSARCPSACAAGCRSSRARCRSAWSSPATTPGCPAATTPCSRGCRSPASIASWIARRCLLQVVDAQRVADAAVLGDRRIEERRAVLGDVHRDVAVALLRPRPAVGQALREHFPAGFGVGAQRLPHRAGLQRIAVGRPG